MNKRIILYAFIIFIITSILILNIYCILNYNTEVNLLRQTQVSYVGILCGIIDLIVLNCTVSLIVNKIERLWNKDKCKT